MWGASAVDIIEEQQEKEEELWRERDKEIEEDIKDGHGRLESEPGLDVKLDETSKRCSGDSNCIVLIV